MARAHPHRQPNPEALLWRRAFLSALGADTPLYAVFEHIPDIAFFAKDSEFRILCASRPFYERFGFQSEEEILGRDDFELFPRPLAETFRKDDTLVIQTGEPRLNLVELFFNRQGIPDWYVTNKLPLKDASGKVIGLMGTTHSYETRRSVLQPFFQIDRAIAHIRNNFRDKITVEELAQKVHISVRQLHRKFVDAFGVGPQGFILKVRIQAACEALQNENALIADVSRSLGFCDQSAFTQAFHKHIGITPRQYQIRFRLKRQ